MVGHHDCVFEQQKVTGPAELFDLGEGPGRRGLRADGDELGELELVLAHVLGALAVHTALARPVSCCCYLPFAVDFLLAAVGVHVVELVLLVAGGGGAAQVQVVRVPDGGADAHLVREGLHGRGGVGGGLGGAGPRCVSLELGLQQCVVNCV